MVRRNPGLVWRLLVTVAFFMSAIAPGVCAALCNLRGVCCEAEKTVARSAPAKCYHCPQSSPEKSGYRTPEHEKDCCAWIAKKIDPPTTLVKSLGDLPAFHAAILPPGISVSASEPDVFSQPIFLVDGRAPPDGRRLRFDPRGPPAR